MANYYSNIKVLILLASIALLLWLVDLAVNPKSHRAAPAKTTPTNNIIVNDAWVTAQNIV